MRFFAVEGKLYKLTAQQIKVLDHLYSRFDEEDHSLRLEWIEKNGKYVDTCEVLAY